MYSNWISKMTNHLIRKRAWSHLKKCMETQILSRQVLICIHMKLVTMWQQRFSVGPINIQRLIKHWFKTHRDYEHGWISQRNNAVVLSTNAMAMPTFISHLINTLTSSFLQSSTPPSSFQICYETLNNRNNQNHTKVFFCKSVEKAYL